MADPAVVALRKKRLWNSDADSEPRLTRSSATEVKKENFENGENKQSEENCSASESAESRPVWSNSLKKIIEEEVGWLVGTACSLEDAYEVIEAHSRSILCDYVKSHPSSVSKKQRNCEQSRLLWHAKHIPFDGTPFTVKAYHQFRCAFAMKYKPKKKADDNSNGPVKSDPRPPYKGVLWTDCPAKIIIKEIKKYPDFSIPVTASKQKKMNSLKRLKLEIKNKNEVGEELRIIVSFPKPHVHNHPFCGKNRATHPEVMKKIKSYVEKGITSPKKIRSLLSECIREEFSKMSPPPSSSDHAYYPPLKVIQNAIFSHSKKSNLNNHNGPAAKVKRKEAPKRPPPAKKEPSPAAAPLSPEPTTLEEAVEAFCSETFSEIVDYNPSEVKNISSSDLAKKVREKLDDLYSLTYSITDSNKLQILYDNVQLMTEQFCSKQGDVIYGYQEQPMAVSPEGDSSLSAYPLSVMMASYPLANSEADSCFTPIESSQSFILPKGETEIIIEQTTLNHDQL